MVDVLRRISAPAMAGILAFSVAGSRPPEQAKAGSEVDTAQEEFVYLPDWKCDAGRFGRVRSLESDANVRPEVSVGDGVFAVTYQRNDDEEENSPVFSTVIFNSADLQLQLPGTVVQRGNVLQPGTVLTFFSDDCDLHVPPADRDLLP